jgi:hypothetical protein
MTDELIKIDAAEFGITQITADTIAGKFKPVNDTMQLLRPRYDALVEQEITPQVSDAAKVLLREYKATRISTAKIHKGEKAFFLAGGKFVQKFKNMQLEIVEPIEEKLSGIANHFINIEKEIAEKLQIERWGAIRIYMPDAPIIENLGTMSDDMFDSLFTGAKMRYDEAQAVLKAKLDMEGKIERRARLGASRRVQLLPYEKYWLVPYAEMYFAGHTEKEFAVVLKRYKKEQSDYEAKQEKIRKENERLKAEKLSTLKKQRVIEAARIKKENEAQRVRDDKVRTEKSKRDAELKAEQDKAAKIQAENDAESAKLRAELKSKEDEEQRVEAERIAKEQSKPSVFRQACSEPI